MEDLRNQDIKITSHYLPTMDAYVLIIGGKSYRMTEDQFEYMQADTTLTYSRKIMEAKN